MKKPILLAWCDFICPTGFGHVAKELLDQTHHTYDTHVIGINYDGQSEYDRSKYTVYKAERKDIGADQVLTKAAALDPDIIFMFQDIFHISELIPQVKKVAPKAKIVVYFPVDGGPLSVMWENVFYMADHIILYTQWSKDMVESTYGKMVRPHSVIYHGVNRDIFKPLPGDEIKKLKKKQNWDDKFVVCNVNRFQPRKQVPLSARAWSMFAKGYNKCNECNHHQPMNIKTCELCMGGDLKTVETPKDDVMYYMHMMPVEYSMGTQMFNSINNHLLNAGFADGDLGRILDVNTKKIYEGEVPLSRVNEFYNMSDLNLSSSMGEGAGLSLLESASVGIPTVAPKNSAIPEMLGPYGTLVKNAAVANFPMDSGFMRPLVDDWEMAKAIKKYYKQWKKRGGKRKVNQAQIKRIERDFDWDDKREELYSIFEQVRTTTK